MSPCSERISEIFVSCSVGSSSFFESWVRMCHVPSLMMLKKLSSFDRGCVSVFGNGCRLKGIWCVVILRLRTLGLVFWSGSKVLFL